MCSIRLQRCLLQCSAGLLPSSRVALTCPTLWPLLSRCVQPLLAPLLTYLPTDSSMAVSNVYNLVEVCVVVWVVVWVGWVGR